MPEIVILSWDYREQPDMAEFHRAVNDISQGLVHIREVDTCSDQYAVIVSDAALSDEEAAAAYRDWEVSDANL